MILQIIIIQFWPESKKDAEVWKKETEREINAQLVTKVHPKLGHKSIRFVLRKNTEWIKKTQNGLKLIFELCCVY